MDVLIPVSAGCLIDQISILEIKKARIVDRDKHENVCRELDALQRIRAGLPELSAPAILQIEQEIRKVNATLWDVEDELRLMELQQNFGEQFISAARRVYLTNDKRSQLKRQIDSLSGSSFVEEKSFSRQG